MVDVQSISITLAALSFLVAASYYVLNLREIRRNRQITLTTTLLQPFMSDEGYIKIMDLLAMQWDSLEEFMNKYDSRVNPENAASRMSLWNACETLGMLYRDGFLDLKTIISASGGIINSLWVKFGPVIESYRGNDYATNSYENFEYLASQIGELLEFDKLAPRHTIPERKK
jgi:hypothetical protein